ncbi:MAG: hypothetical protein KAS66_02200 [Candidatus Omnitrophica bacterium]|nr:hypothetical protein [Candidatus Omnitrophota bacterium]
MVYFFNITTAIIISLFLLPFWYIEDAVIVPSIQMTANVLVIPVILVALNVSLYARGRIRFFSILYLVIPLACLAGEICAYFNWGISTGDLLRPDEETIIITMVYSVASMGLSLLLLAAAHVVLKLFGKAQNL